MSIRPDVRNAALVGALAAVAVTAWATNEEMSDSTYVSVPANTVAIEQTTMSVSEPVVVNEPVAPATQSVTVPVADRSVTQPGITVQERRLSNDERIQAQVMDKLASNSRLSGKIGVESHDAVVTLSGYTSTVGQAWRAGNEARGVIGVKYVENQIRPRVGGSI
jgi:osmotically-inducible protein OsmY